MGKPFAFNVKKIEDKIAIDLYSRSRRNILHHKPPKFSKGKQIMLLGYCAAICAAIRAA